MNKPEITIPGSKHAYQKAIPVTIAPAADLGLSPEDWVEYMAIHLPVAQLRQFRQEAELTQEGMLREFGISPSRISRMERGGCATIQAWARVAAKLGKALVVKMVDMEELEKEVEEWEGEW